MSMKNKIKKIINFKVQKNEKETLQRRALKALFAFLFVMIICTMLSRFADSLTIPVIEVEKPKSKTMVDEVKAEGRIVKNREEKLSSVEGLKVDYVNVSVGSSIKVGDVLVELNVEDLTKKVEEIKANIAKEQKTLTRANEDYSKAIVAKNEAVKKAANEMNTSKKALDDYNSLKDEEKDPMLGESLKAEYESKSSIYNSAVNDANDTLDLDRVLQDVKDSLQIDTYNAELSKLQPLLDASGKIVSDKEGIVTSVFAENGGTTADTILSIADKNAGYKFIGQVEKSKRSSIKQGQNVSLSINGYGQVNDLTVEAVSKSNENPEYLDVTVMLPVGVGEIDDNGEIIISSQAKKFRTCVPLTALRQGDNGTYYILTVGEKETVLGTEKVAKKVEVRIEKKDGEFAAISDGMLSNGEQIIVGSNKTVDDGDRVRLETK